MLENVSVVVLSFNRKEELVKNLLPLCKALPEYKFDFIIVDNNSNDGSKELLKHLKSKNSSIRLVFNSENLGVAEGRNSGRRLAKGDYVLHLDDDTSITVHDIKKMRDILIKYPEVGVVSPKVIHARTKTCQNYHGEINSIVGNYHGACHMVKKEAMKEVGCIDSLCRFGGEELDYSIRMQANGYRILYEPSITVAHNNIKRDGKEGKWRRRMRVYNFCRLHFKHFRFQKAILFTIRYCLSHMLSGSREHSILFSLTLPYQAFKGAREGRKQYSFLPCDVESFYTDQNVRPEFGNVPILRKFIETKKKKQDRIYKSKRKWTY